MSFGGSLVLCAYIDELSEQLGRLVKTIGEAGGWPSAYSFVGVRPPAASISPNLTALRPVRLGHPVYAYTLVAMFLVFSCRCHG